MIPEVGRNDSKGLSTWPQGMAVELAITGADGPPPYATAHITRLSASELMSEEATLGTEKIDLAHWGQRLDLPPHSLTVLVLLP